MILRIGNQGESTCTEADAIHAVTCAVLQEPLPSSTCGEAVSDSAGTTVVHVHRGAHPESAKSSAELTLPPNVLQREEMRAHFSAPNRSLGVEWLRPGL